MKNSAVRQPAGLHPRPATAAEGALPSPAPVPPHPDEAAAGGVDAADRPAEPAHPAPGDPGPDDRDREHGHWRQWLASPAGRYVLAWEQSHLDQKVANLFGFVAVQCGLRELQALRQNRMRSRFLVSRSDEAAHYGKTHPSADVVIDSYEELPLAAESADLLVLPHVLEFAQNPHQVLREVDRVLRPNGRLIVTGFNPVSLWGISQTLGRLTGRPVLPPDEHFIGLPRLRDWCKLLSFEFQAGSYGCYRPLLRHERWLERTAFLEKAGDRWWPICGAVYSMTVVKRVRGMRLIDPVWKRSRRRASVSAVGAPVGSSGFGTPGYDDLRALPPLRLVSSSSPRTSSRESSEA